MENLEGKDKEIDNQKHTTDELLHTIEADFDDREKFNNTMDLFYEGDVEGYENIEKMIGMNMQEIGKELADVLNNTVRNPDDYNLTARLYTQETNKKIGEILEVFGFELYQKYTIAGSKDDIGESFDENDYDFVDDKSVNIYPEFIFTDIRKFIAFLKKIKATDKRLEKNIALVINSIGKKIYNGFQGYWTDEELDIYNTIPELSQEIERLGLEKEAIIDNRYDCFIALRDGYLDKFRECIKAGFYTKISSEEVYPPLFFEDNINMDTEYEKIISNPRHCKNVIMQMDKDIKESRYILDEIKDTKPLLEKVIEEFNAGIVNVINIIKDTKKLKKSEKRRLIEHFNDYLCKTRYMNIKNHHKENE